MNLATADRVSCLPIRGDHIVFDRLPIGSWAAVGVVYRVEHCGKAGHDYRLVGIAEGGATFETARALRSSSWHIAKSAT